MPKTKRFSLAIVQLIAVVAAILIGLGWRSRLDLGASVPSPRVMALKTLYASREESADIPESDYFYALTQLVKQKYVDEVDDDMKLAVGAVKGMVTRLADPLANYMNKDQFKAFLASQRGNFEGIGVEVRFIYDEKTLEKLRDGKRIEDTASLIPQVVVSAVVPDSPAAKAGLQPGDEIEAVNGRWVMSSKQILALRKESTALRESKLEPDEMNKRMRALMDRLKNGITPARVRDVMTLGETGTVKVAWMHGKERTEAELSKASSVLAPVASGSEGYRLAFVEGAARELAEKLASNSTMTLDLRNSGVGNYDELQKILEATLPKGKYGTVLNEKGQAETSIEVKTGAKVHANLTLIVDSTTRGAAEIFARIAESARVAKLQGQTAGENAMIEVIALPDGSGYTLPTGRLKALPVQVKKEAA